MNIYHFNPDTGETGVCKAIYRCKFGEEQPHYNSPEDAAKAYEAKMQFYAVPQVAKKDQIIAAAANSNITVKSDPKLAEELQKNVMQILKISELKLEFLKTVYALILGLYSALSQKGSMMTRRSRPWMNFIKIVLRSLHARRCWLQYFATAQSTCKPSVRI